MPQVFTLETGAGLSTANALAAVADADQHWLDRPNDTRGAAWALAATASKQDAIIRATDYVRANPRYRWRGVKNSYAQRLPWPRTGAQEADGQAVPSDAVPWQVALGVIVLAARLVAGEAASLVDLERGGRIRSESIGPISTTYMDDAPIGTVIQEVDGIFATLLQGSAPVVPTALDFEHVALPNVFENGYFTPFTTTVESTDEST